MPLADLPGIMIVKEVGVSGASSTGRGVRLKQGNVRGTDRKGRLAASMQCPRLRVSWRGASSLLPKEPRLPKGCRRIRVGSRNAGQPGLS